MKIKCFNYGLVLIAFCNSVLALTPPTIYIQPQDQLAAVGYPVLLAVGITNSSPPFPAVQWQKNAQPIPKATNSSFSSAPTTSGPGYATPSFYYVSYTVTNAQLADAGNFSVVLSNSVGVVTSQVVTVTIIPAATFITMAGNKAGTNDGVGTNAAFSGPRHIAIDMAGNLYVTDFANYTIRKITPAGIVSTLAGTPGVAGTNDGYGSNALFTHPHGIAADTNGNLFVTDLGFNWTVGGVIRKISPGGLVATIAGTPNVSGTNDGSGNTALFQAPLGIATDNDGNLFVSDTLNHTVRKLASDGTNWVVSTIAGLPGSTSLTDGTNADARFLLPDGLAVDQAGNVFVADENSNGGAIRKMTLVGTNWVISTVVGPTTFVRLANPSAVAVDTNGCLYVSQQGSYPAGGQIRKIIPDGTNWITATIAGNPSSLATVNGTGITNRFYTPHGITLDKYGNMFVVVDMDASLIRKGWSSDSQAACILYPPNVNAGQVQLDALVATGSATNFILLQSDQLSGAWITNSARSLTTNIYGLYYRLTMLADESPSRFYRLQIQ
jgi:hypothetical protein